MFVLQDLNFFGGTLPACEIYVFVFHYMVSLCVHGVASFSLFTGYLASSQQSSACVPPSLRWRRRLVHGQKLLRSKYMAARSSARAKFRTRNTAGLEDKVQPASTSRCRSHLAGLHNRRPGWLSSNARFIFWKRRMLKWKAKRFRWKTVQVGPWTDASPLSSEATLVGESFFSLFFLHKRHKV